MGMLRLLNNKGDVAVAWRPEVAEETAHAQEVFNNLMSQGKAAYEVVEGVGNELIREFKPDAEEIVAFNPIVGG